MPLRLLMMTALVALLLTVPARAGSEPAVTDSVKLSTVEVTARRPFADVIPAQVLDGERLGRLGVHSVADAMRYFSGIQIKDYGGVGGVKTVDMRSMGSNHLGVFYDGIQLGNAQNGQIDLGKFSLDNMEQISLYNGQRSEIFQSAKDFGSAGTVYLQSRRPRFEEGRDWNLNATFRTGSFGLVNPSVRFDRRLSDRVSATLSAEYTYATGRYRFRYRKVFADGSVAWDTTATRRNGDINAMRLEAGLYGTLYRGYWQAKLYYYDSERGIPGAIVNNVWKNSQRQWDRNFFAQGRFQRTFSTLYALQVNAKYAHDYMHYLNPDTTLMYIDNSFRQDEVYISTAQRFTIAKGWEAALSADYQFNTLSSSMANFTEPRRHTLMVAAATSAAVGRLKAQASLLGTFVADRTEPPAQSSATGARTNRFDKVTPALFASWTPSAKVDWSVRGFYKRIFRMPTFNDLYYTDIGNANLRPEYAGQLNIGSTYHTDFHGSPLWNSLDISLDAYHNTVTDKIIAVPKGNGQYRWMMMNIGKVKITGVDVTAALTVSPVADLHLNGRLSYTWQRALDYSDPSDNRDEAGTYKGQISYVPRHSGSATLNAQWRRAELDYSFIYVGERYHNSSNIAANHEEPWYTHDLSLSYLFALNRVALRVTAEINNLLNQQYDVIRNYPMPGRNYRVILRLDI